jgi:hypothetical protein
MDVDDDVLPVVERMGTALTGLEAAVETVYSAQLSEDKAVETMSLDEQANLATVSAFAIAMALYCHKKANNEPVGEQLLQKIVRVREYNAKVKGDGRLQKRYLDERAGDSSDEEDDAPKSLANKKRPRVDQDAVAALMRL